MLSLVAYLAIQTQVADPTIEFVNAGARLATLLPELGKAMRRRVVVDSAIADEIGVLRLHEIPMSAAIAKISDEFDLEWKPTKEGFRVSRTADLRRRRRERDINFIAAQFRLDRKRMLDQVKSKPPATDAQIANAIHEFASSLSDSAGDPPLPHQQFGDEQWIDEFYGVLDTIDPRLLGSMYLGQRLVLSASPNAHQRVMGAETRLAIDHALKNIARSKPRWIMAVQHEIAALQGRKSAVEMLQQVVSQLQEPFLPANTKPLIEIRRQADSISISLEFVRGNQIVQSYDISPADGDADDDRKRIVEVKGELASDPFLVKQMKRITASNLAEPPTDEDARVLLHPETVEPISLGIGFKLIHLADMTNANLVASPPDNAEVELAMNYPEFEKAPQFVVFLSSSRLDFKKKDGWLSFFASSRLEAEQQRANRPTLARYAQLMYSDQSSTLNEQVSFRLNGIPEFDDGLMTLIGPLTCGGLEPAQVSPFASGLDPLALYADLANGPSGRGVPIALLPDHDRTLIERMVYDQYLEFDEDRANSQRNRRGEFPLEMTELFPQGLPGDSVVRLTRSSRLVGTLPPAAGANPHNRRSGRPVDRLATMLYSNEVRQKRGRPAVYASDRVILGTSEEVSVELIFNNGQKLSYAITYSDARSAKEMPWSEAPAEFRQAVEQKRESYRQNAVETPKRVKPPL